MTDSSIAERADERGAILILALVLIVILGVAAVFLGQMSTGALLTSENLKTQRSSVEDAQTAVTIAIQNVRYNFSYYTSNTYSLTTAEPCLPAGVSIPSSLPGSSAVNDDIVSCTGFVTPGSAATRTVTFTACPNSGALTCTSSSALLVATVTFDDQPASGAAPSCNNHTVVTCGGAMTIQAWDLVGADR